MPDEPVPYKFPTSSDEAEWIGKVQAAVGHTLKWTRASGHGQGWWVLSGACPRCDHDMSQLVYFGDVILPDTFGGTEVKPASEAKEANIQVVCNCAGGHKRDVQGCGFGKGIRVSLQSP